MGMGFDGYGHRLLWKTLGWPVTFPRICRNPQEWGWNGTGIEWIETGVEVPDIPFMAFHLFLFLFMLFFI